mgnify:CR=1 FL=1
MTSQLKLAARMAPRDVRLRRVESVRRLILAGRLGRSARGHYEAREGEQYRPTMFADGTPEFEKWKTKYRYVWKEYECQSDQQSQNQKSSAAYSADLDQSEPLESFALVAGTNARPLKPNRQTTPQRSKQTKSKPTMDELILATDVDLSSLSDEHRAAAAGWPYSDREVCLRWAAEQGATVSEMRAYYGLRTKG